MGDVTNSLVACQNMKTNFQERKKYFNQSSDPEIQNESRKLGLFIRLKSTRAGRVVDVSQQIDTKFYKLPRCSDMENVWKIQMSKLLQEEKVSTK